MSNKIIRYLIIFAIVEISAIFFYNWNSQKKLYDMHSCCHQLIDFGMSIHAKTEKNLKQNQASDQEKKELRATNLELLLENIKLLIELKMMENLLREEEPEIPVNEPPREVRV